MKRRRAIQVLAFVAVVLFFGAYLSAFGHEASRPAWNGAPSIATGLRVGAEVAHVPQLLAQVGEEWEGPVYRSFVTIFYLALQVLATLATVVFIFVVLLKREEE